jgi:hypothetical protein
LHHGRHQSRHLAGLSPRPVVLLRGDPSVCVCMPVEAPIAVLPVVPR